MVRKILYYTKEKTIPMTFDYCNVNTFEKEILYCKYNGFAEYLGFIAKPNI